MEINKIEIISVLEKVESSKKQMVFRSCVLKIKEAFAGLTREPDMTLEKWERLERKYSPHSSHHAQIYYRDRGL